MTAFYTSRLFQVERLILKWLVVKPSTDREADLLAAVQLTVLPLGPWKAEGRTSCYCAITKAHTIMADFRTDGRR